MKMYLSFFVLAVASLSTLLAASVSRNYGDRIDVDGHHLRVRIEGRVGPAVVLETFGVAPLECWALVQPRGAKFARVFAYDHAGYWGSQPGPRPRDARQIAGELHVALQQAGLPPPYVRVGYSFGGPSVRGSAA